MSHEVVDLLGDSGDEEPKKMQQEATLKSAAANHDDSFVDLYDDSDDEDLPVMKTPATLRQSSPKRKFSASAAVTISSRKSASSTASKAKISPVRYNKYPASDDSDSDIPVDPVFAKKRPSPSASPKTSSPTKKNRQLERSPSVNSSTKVPPTSTSFQPETIAIDLSDSDGEVPRSQKSVSSVESTSTTGSARKFVLNPYNKTPSAQKTQRKVDDITTSPPTAPKEATATPKSSIPSSSENPSVYDSDSDLEDLATRPTFAKNTSSAKVTSITPPNPYDTPRAKTAPKPAPTVRSPAAFANSTFNFQYPTLLTNSRQHDDIRAKLILAFWKVSRSMERSFERPKLDQLTKKVVRLALSRHALRSVDEFIFSFGKASVTSAPQQKEEFQKQLDAGGYGITPTPRTRYGQGFYTITEACLVVLYEHVQRQMKDDVELSDTLKEKESWLLVDEMIPLIDARLRPECPSKLTRAGEENDCGAAYYLTPSTRSAEFMQIAKLECELGDECGPRIKRHRRNGKVYFELLEVGYVDAEYIRGRSFPSGKGHYRTSNISDKVEAKFADICLGMDRQEGGGGGKALHEMCGKLDMCKVPYFVGTLAIGDYVFFTGKNNKLNLLCPILVERKSVQDVAQSIYDGRWTAQKARMYKGQYLFGYNKCKMVYIIEGNENKQLVNDGYIGNRWHGVTKEKLQAELDKLKSEGFEVIRTPSRESTMFELARWTERIAGDIKKGALKSKFTYQEFKDELKKIPANTDFSRLAKDHAANKAEEEAEVEVEVTSVENNGEPSAQTSKWQAETSPKLIPPVAKKTKIDVDDEYSILPTTRLREMCKSVGIAKSGSRSEVIARWRGPHPPRVWLTRKQRGEHVPNNYDVAGTALLVALYLHEKKTGGLDAGLNKDELYVQAEGLNITKNPFSGGTTQTGPYHYDGWSSMGTLLKGDPALVKLSKKRYKLTRSCDLAGYCVAEAMHKWCHAHDNCPCGQSL